MINEMNDSPLSSAASSKRKDSMNDAEEQDQVKQEEEVAE